MVKDKIIQMDNGISYYIIEEIEYNDTKYVLSVECDLDKDKVDEENYLVMELSIVDGNFIIKRIEDNELAKIITLKLLEKINK